MARFSTRPSSGSSASKARSGDASSTGHGLQQGAFFLQVGVIFDDFCNLPVHHFYELINLIDIFICESVGGTNRSRRRGIIETKSGVEGVSKAGVRVEETSDLGFEPGPVVLDGVEVR